MRKQQFPEPRQEKPFDFLIVNVVLSLMLLVIVLIYGNLNKEFNDLTLKRFKVLESRVEVLDKKCNAPKVIGEYLDFSGQWRKIESDTIQVSEGDGYTYFYGKDLHGNLDIYSYDIVQNKDIVWHENPDADLVKKEKNRRQKAKYEIEMRALEGRYAPEVKK